MYNGYQGVSKSKARREKFWPDIDGIYRYK